MKRCLRLTIAICVGCGARPPVAPEPVVVPIQPPPAPMAAPEPRRTPESAPIAAAGDPGGAPPPFVPPSKAGRGQTPRVSRIGGKPLARRWSVKVGKTTFRTTMAFVDGAVVVGTHGDSLDGKNEASDAVYVLEGKTGKVLRRIATPGKGDRDVGGVAVDAGHVVFSTDNGQVVKARLSDGAVVWTAKLAGKVRPAPALADLDGKGARDVVVGDEEGTLHALAGDDGAVLWTRATGENDYDARGFVAAAAVADLDGDGRDDVVAGARDGALVAYRGGDGEELWREEGGSGIHASPVVVDLDGDGRSEVLAAWSYSRVAILDAPTGAVRYEQELSLDQGGIEGLFGSPVPLPASAGPGLLVQGTSWWGGKPGTRGAAGLVDGVVLVGQQGRAYRADEGRVSSSAVVVDLDDDGSWEAVLGTEAGELLVLGADGKRSVLSKLGGPIEAPALVADVDGDGRYEILVASNDGMLTCLSTSSKTKPLVSRFRGETPDNRGALGAIALGWRVQDAAPAAGQRPSRSSATSAPTPPSSVRP